MTKTCEHRRGPRTAVIAAMVVGSAIGVSGQEEGVDPLMEQQVWQAIEAHSS